MAEQTLKELEPVALRQDLPEYGLVVGDVGTVVFVHRDGQAYEVEFTDADGRTLAVQTLSSDQVAPVRGRQILHVRPLTTAAG
jgi:uncharacterized protein DUF4926